MIFKNDSVNNDRFLIFFEKISAIPHGSGNTGMISDYLVSFARERNLRYIQEPCGNVIIFKDHSSDRNSAGQEESPVILQGHMDMVSDFMNKLEHLDELSDEELKDLSNRIKKIRGSKDQ